MSYLVPPRQVFAAQHQDAHGDEPIHLLGDLMSGKTQCLAKSTVRKQSSPETVW